MGQTYVLIEYHGHTASLPESLTGHIKAIGRAVKSLYFVGKCATPTGLWYVTVKWCDTLQHIPPTTVVAMGGCRVDMGVKNRFATVHHVYMVLVLSPTPANATVDMEVQQLDADQTSMNV